VYELDGTLIEFRLPQEVVKSLGARNLEPGMGGVPIFEVRTLNPVLSSLDKAGVKSRREFAFDEGERGGRLTSLDIEGNAFEFWERGAAF
jgi:hypothetical protein